MLLQWGEKQAKHSLGYPRSPVVSYERRYTLIWSNGLQRSEVILRAVSQLYAVSPHKYFKKPIFAATPLVFHSHTHQQDKPPLGRCCWSVRVESRRL